MTVRRVIGLLTVIGLLASATYLVLWWFGTFSPSPGAVIQEILEKANRGRHHQAAAKLASETQTSFGNNPEVPYAVFDAISRSGTIGEITIFSEDCHSNTADVSFAILYKDGQRLKIRETCRLERGAWKPLFRATIATAAPDLDLWNPKNAKTLYFAVAAARAELNGEFTKIPWTRIRIRLPAGTNWVSEAKLFGNKELMFELRGMEHFFASYETTLERARIAFDTTPDFEVGAKDERDVVVQGRQGKLLLADVRVRKTGYPFHAMQLVFPTKQSVVWIDARVPPVTRLKRLLEESLMTTEWGP